MRVQYDRQPMPKDKAPPPDSSPVGKIEWPAVDERVVPLKLA
ncbi:MAG TPA: hypothetical protein VG294_06840 [Solirubrobacteraceae bacterium]|nr:hypothetical protein [Solirubrobacteraceae bacterium]